MRRETTRVSFLMCPFCVRAVLLRLTTKAVHVTDEPHRDRPCASLEMDAELTQFYECCLAPADGIRGEREHEGHPVLFTERLTVAQDVVVAGRGLDRKAGCFEPADELADVLPHLVASSSAGVTR
jgi:hypothetical protein